MLWGATNLEVYGLQKSTGLIIGYVFDIEKYAVNGVDSNLLLFDDVHFG
jgi:hypothetical protein